MNKERMLLLRAKMVQVQEDEKLLRKFNMRQWFNNKPFNELEFGASVPLGEQLAKCGAAACAFGYACEIPEFKAAGLEIMATRINGDGSNFVEPVFEQRSGFGAAEEFFGISRADAEFLFDPEEYQEDAKYDDGITPLHVVERIDELLTLGEPT